MRPLTTFSHQFLHLYITSHFIHSLTTLKIVVKSMKVVIINMGQLLALVYVIKIFIYIK